ncbi:hypothetical protein C8Q73DRAFT_660101 [Cubamyces lactineus]|nr:hypothetical protein C8Q73DRAFT_660101 [Cubamyces lactineus]
MSRTLLSINADALNVLLSTAALTKSLKALSLTCREMRLHCLPFLFKECTLRNYVPVQSVVFFPRELTRFNSPTVSILHFIDNCPDQSVDFHGQREGHPKYTNDPLLCGVYSTDYLKTALSDMPQLHTMTSNFGQSVVRLRLKMKSVIVNAHRIAPSLRPGEGLRINGRSAPLTSLCHVLSGYRPDREKAYSSQEHALELFLNASRDTLERLTLSTDCAPLPWMCKQSCWPRLHELRLRGELRIIENPPRPLVSMFANMPELRILELKLAQPVDRDPQAFWPPSHRITGSFPWPELRELTLSCPQIHDNIYASLPSSLHSLTLRYTPHHLNYTTKLAFRVTPQARWQWPLLSSSDMLQILHQCRLPDLRHLALEYREDEADEELLQYIKGAYPALRCLRLFRCPSNHRLEPLGDPVVLVVSRSYVYARSVYQLSHHGHSHRRSFHRGTWLNS